jgi:DnaJ-class molecular chaperone
MSDKQIDYNCPSCGGKGFIWVVFFNHDHHQKTCHWCRGTGKFFCFGREKVFPTKEVSSDE